MSPTPPHAATSKRSKRRLRIEERCADATTAEHTRAAAVDRRNRLLAESQGPPAEGKFTYTELAEISGLTRTRVAQIIRDVRRGGAA